ncbi:MAG: DNA gyrase subunit A [Gammaproteobacteria bacterium]|nr:MAG: DNA gyrase subunit A [Gammaproteobacteria bacterium]
MSDFAKEILPINLEDEMRQSFLDYAMSVIVSRALPDVRDGLKPVHRRILYAMHEQNYDWNRPYRKSARVVGDVMGKYHPHGDSAIYDSMVRMAQPFSMRYMLIDGQGNFGSVDGDPPAAMRYTEVRMEKLTRELLSDIDKETVDFIPNYDGSEAEPAVLPSRIPNLLVNGGTGIAVGMATNIPPHNISEVLNATIALLDDPELTVEGLMQHLPGPDFPTHGIINGARGIREAYATGRGKIYLRARADVEHNEKTGRDVIVVTELPYQVNKARLLEKIGELHKDRKIEGISELRDESDKDGMRVVIEMKRGESGDVMLNQLYKQTQLQVVFGINMVALDDGQPKLLNLREILDAFIRHRREVVTRRTIFELRKARDRAHVLEGLAVALANIDPIIELIKASQTSAEARERLVGQTWEPGIVSGMLERAGAESSRPEELDPRFGLHDGRYQLSEVQAQAILDLRLHRLTGLEQDKIIEEYKEILEKIEGFLLILTDPDRLREVVRGELVELIEQYGDQRRTDIQIDHSEMTVEDLIADEAVVVTLSHSGYIKAQPLSDYRAQKRGGRGKSATSMKEEDFVDKLFIASMHDTVLFFTSVGKVYWKRVFELPVASRNSRGRPIVNLLPLEEDERVNAILTVREYSHDQFVFFATSKGVVKKTALTDFSRPRTNGIIAIDLRIDDYLIDVALTDGNSDVMLLSSAGRAMRFNEDKVRQMGRTAAGVRGIRMDEKDTVIGLIVVQDGMAVLTATEHGYGKRTPIEDYPAKGRGGLGVIDIKTTERNGAVIGAVQVAEDDEIMLITDAGTLVRTTVAEVSTVGRNTQGVRLIRLSKGETLVEITAIDEHDDHDDHDAIAAERSNDHTVGAEQGHDDRDATPAAQGGDGDGDDDAEQGSDDVSAEQDNDADDD